MPGIYIMKGMTVSIPSFSIRIGKDGALASDPIVLHVRYDVVSTWIRLAMYHSDSAHDACLARQVAWDGRDENAKSKSLEAEFEAAMQAIVAAAIAWDALYGILRHHVEITPATLKAWRTKRTPRYAQVAEVVRRAFRMKPEGTKLLRNNLKEIFRYRDLAIHPPGKVEAAVLHPELDVGVEWRFVYFRASNAKLIVAAASGMLWELAHMGKTASSKVGEYQQTLRARLQEAFPGGPPTLPTAPQRDSC